MLEPGGAHGNDMALGHRITELIHAVHYQPGTGQDAVDLLEGLANEHVADDVELLGRLRGGRAASPAWARAPATWWAVPTACVVATVGVLDSVGDGIPPKKLPCSSRAPTAKTSKAIKPISGHVQGLRPFLAGSACASSSSRARSWSSPSASQARSAPRISARVWCAAVAWLSSPMVGRAVVLGSATLGHHSGGGRCVDVHRCRDGTCCGFKKQHSGDCRMGGRECRRRGWPRQLPPASGRLQACCWVPWRAWTSAGPAQGWAGCQATAAVRH